MVGAAAVAAQLMGAAEAFHARGETRRERIAQHACEETQRLLAAAMAPDLVEYWVARGREVEEAVLANLLERAFSASAPAATPGT